MSRLVYIVRFVFWVTIYPSIVNAQGKTEEFQPYEKVISTGAKSSHGFFTTHLLKGKLYFEIPASLLNVDFIIMQQGNYLQGDRLIRWVMRGEYIQLVMPDIVSQVGVIIPANCFEKGSINDQRPAIVSAFPILSKSSTGSFVIDVTNLFTNSIPGFIEGENDENVEQLGFIEKANAYPSAIEI